MKKLSGKEYEELQKALLSAFPSETALEQFVKFYLNEDLAEITSGDNLGETIFKLIQWAQTYGHLNKLIGKAHQKNPQNPDLSEFYKKYRQQNRQRTPNYLKKKSTSRNKENWQKFSTPLTSRGKVLQKEIKKSVLDLSKLQGDTESAHITESAWLDNFGFVRSPFERLEAGSEEYTEPGFLSNCFVDPDGFLDILGYANAPLTQILYAKRGEGKTACRVMVDYLCLHGGVPDKKTGQSVYVLSVPHIHFHTIIHKLDLEIQVVDIMRRAVSQFADLLTDAEIIRSNLRQIAHTVVVDINWFLYFYSLYLNPQQIELLSHIGFKIPFDSSPYPTLDNRNNMSSLDHLRQWCRLMNDIGIQAVYVLVDGLDELTSTAANLKEAYRLLSPLITNRELLDKTPYFALKCFLPSGMENLILSDKAGRPELIPTQRVSWSNEKLKQLLRKRIQYFRNQEYQQAESGFEEFCVPELYGLIEDELISASYFNPRFLLKLCDLMVEAHCIAAISTESNAYNLNRADLEVAKKNFEHWIIMHENEDVHVGKEKLDIRKIIEAGETDEVEFKSSLIRDLRTNQPNDGLIMKLGKEIAGMLNGNGGILLIGVSDDKFVLGIEGDFEFLGQRNKNRADSRKEDTDGFGLKLIDLIKDNMGAHVLDNIKIDFETVDDKIICMIRVNPASQPVYFGKLEEFFIRMNTSNLRLSTREIIDYVSSHWPTEKNRS